MAGSEIPATYLGAQTGRTPASPADGTFIDFSLKISFLGNSRWSRAQTPAQSDGADDVQQTLLTLHFKHHVLVQPVCVYC